MDEHSKLIVAVLVMVSLFANGLLTGSVWAQDRLIMQPVKRFLLFAKAGRERSPINYWLIMMVYAGLIIACLWIMFMCGRCDTVA